LPLGVEWGEGGYKKAARERKIYVAQYTLFVPMKSTKLLQILIHETENCM
jgi:hypothetical protein